MPFLIAIRKIHLLISQISNPVRPHKKVHFIRLLLSNQRRKSYKKYSRDVEDIEPNIIQPFMFSLDLLMSHSPCCFDVSKDEEFLGPNNLCTNVELLFFLNRE